MRNGNSGRRLPGEIIGLAVGALALLVMVACGGSAEVPASPAAPPGMVFTVPTSAPSTVVAQPPTKELDTPPPKPTATPLRTPKSAAAAYPTATPYPTATAYPTAKPDPTATPAPNPTATPLPTPTPDPTATPTLNPTAAPQPTYTPVPTYTPRPTYIPVLPPTPTPTPKPTPEQLRAHSNLSDKWGYTVSVPAGWKVERSGKETEIRSRDGQAAVQVFAKEYPDKKLAQARFAEEQWGAAMARHAHSSEYFDINLIEPFQKGGHDRFRFA